MERTVQLCKWKETALSLLHSFALDLRQKQTYHNDFPDRLNKTKQQRSVHLAYLVMGSERRAESNCLSNTLLFTILISHCTFNEPSRFPSVRRSGPPLLGFENTFAQSTPRPFTLTGIERDLCNACSWEPGGMLANS